MRIFGVFCVKYCRKWKTISGFDWFMQFFISLNSRLQSKSQFFSSRLLKSQKQKSGVRKQKRMFDISSNTRFILFRLFRTLDNCRKLRYIFINKVRFY